MLDQAEATRRKIEELEQKTYTNSDLGLTFKDGVYTFKVWSPLAEQVSLKLYQTGRIDEETCIKKIDMRLENHVWVISLEEELDGLFYTYEFQHPDDTTEAPDLYSKAVGINGDRTAIIDLRETNPEGWENDQHVMQESITDAIIWEVHV